MANNEMGQPASQPARCGSDAQADTRLAQRGHSSAHSHSTVNKHYSVRMRPQHMTARVENSPSGSGEWIHPVGHSITPTRSLPTGHMPAVHLSPRHQVTRNDPDHIGGSSFARLPSQSPGHSLCLAQLHSTQAWQYTIAPSSGHMGHRRGKQWREPAGRVGIASCKGATGSGSDRSDPEDCRSRGECRVEWHL